MTHFSLKSNGSKTIENVFTGIVYEIPTLKNEERVSFAFHTDQES